MRPLRAQRSTATTAGTNRFNLGLSAGLRLRYIRIINETKSWTTLSANLARRGDVTSNITVGLINRVIQAGNRDVTWDGDVLITDDFPDISADFFDADAGDTLILTAGVEDA